MVSKVLIKQFFKQKNRLKKLKLILKLSKKVFFFQILKILLKMYITIYREEIIDLSAGEKIDIFRYDTTIVLIF